MSDYEVGYGRPPKKHRFRKGQSGNMKGRPKKEKPDNSRAAICERVMSEAIMINGQSKLPFEVMMLQVRNQAMKGDWRAIRELDKLLSKYLPNDGTGQTCGVLVVPAPMSFDEWSVKAAEQQAKWREGGDDEPDCEPVG